MMTDEDRETLAAKQEKNKQQLFNALLHIQAQARNAVDAAGSTSLMRESDLNILTMFLAETYANSGDTIHVASATGITRLVNHLVEAAKVGELEHTFRELENVLIDVAHRVIRDKMRQEAAALQPTLISRVTSLSTSSQDGAASEAGAASTGGGGGHLRTTTMSTVQEAVSAFLQIVQHPGVGGRLKRVAAVLFEQVGDTREVIKAYLGESAGDMNYAKQVFAYIERCASEYGARVPGVTNASSTSGKSKASSGSGGGGGSATSVAEVHEGLESLRSTVLSLLPELTKLDRNRAAQVVLLLFPDQHETVIQKLQDPWLQFNYLQQLMKVSGLMSSSGNASASSMATGTGMTDLLERSGTTVTPEMHKLYVKLLCQFEKESVLIYLKSNDQYPIDDCLRLCERYQVAEARSYLLERTGDVHGAMVHLLSALESVLGKLSQALNDETRIRSLARRKSVTGRTSPRAFRARSTSRGSVDAADVLALESIHRRKANTSTAVGVSKGLGRPYVPPLVRGLAEWQKCESSVLELVGLCERNSHMNLDRAADMNEKLWFTLLDAVVAHKHQASEGEGSSAPESAPSPAPAPTSFNSKFAAESLRMVLADFVHVILTHMNGHVSLPSVLAKITNDHRHQKFREFRSTITGMLENVRYEQSILQTAKQLLADAKYRQVRNLHRGYALRVKNVYLDEDEGGGGTEGRRRRQRSNSMMGEDGAPLDKASLARIRRLQKGRRRDRKAHPPLNEVLKQLNGGGGGGGDSDSEDEDFEDGSPVVPHGHLVLELEPRYRTGFAF